MPRGPKGEKRPADVIGAAVIVGRIATRLTNQHPKMRGKTISNFGDASGQMEIADQRSRGLVCLYPEGRRIILA
jgi:hypothetical protein